MIIQDIDKGKHFDWGKEHFNMLETVAPESFMVKHYVSIAELQVKHVG